MKLNPFGKRQAQPPPDQEFTEVAAVERHPWLGENIQDWDHEEYEPVVVEGTDTRGATRGYYLRHRATQTIVGRIRSN